MSDKYIVPRTLTPHLVALGDARVRMEKAGPNVHDMHEALLRALGIVEALCHARVSFTPLHEKSVNSALHEVAHLLQLAEVHSRSLKARADHHDLL
jgi:hypothetical protein